MVIWICCVHASVLFSLLAYWDYGVVVFATIDDKNLPDATLEICVTVLFKLRSKLLRNLSEYE